MSFPPGASYRIANASIVAKRRLLHLEDPVRIQFTQMWKSGNPLFDWYTRRSSRLIHTIQLRKEHESPFFHEYVVFSLEDGSCFRVDRRQRPDENTPLDSIYENGVEANDTIEEVASFNDALYCSSDCLIELKFKDSVHIELDLLLEICRAIQAHPRAKMYTLQHFNCYFFAQTIFLCTARHAFETPSQEPVPLRNGDDPSLPFRYTMLTESSEAESSQANSIGSSCCTRPNRWFPAWTPGVNIPHTTLDMEQIFGFHSKHWWSMSTRASSKPCPVMVPTGSKIPANINISRLIVELCSRQAIASIHQCETCRYLPVSIDPTSVSQKLSDRLQGVQSLLAGFWDTLLSSICQTLMTYDPALRSFSLWDKDLDQEYWDLAEAVASELAFPGGGHIHKYVWKQWARFSGDILDSFIASLFRKLLPSHPKSICPSWEPEPHEWGKYKGVPDALIRDNAVIKQWRTETAQFFISQYDHLARVLWDLISDQLNHYRVCQKRSDRLRQRADVKFVNKDSTILRSRRIRKLPPHGYHDIYHPDHSSVQVSLHDQTQSLIRKLIRAHSNRVEQYKVMLKYNAHEVERVICGTMSDIWWATRKLGRSNHLDFDLSDFKSKVNSLKSNHYKAE